MTVSSSVILIEIVHSNTSIIYHSGGRAGLQIRECSRHLTLTISRQKLKRNKHNGTILRYTLFAGRTKTQRLIMEDRIFLPMLVTWRLQKVVAQPRCGSLSFLFRSQTEAVASGWDAPFSGSTLGAGELVEIWNAAQSICSDLASAHLLMHPWPMQATWGRPGWVGTCSALWTSPTPWAGTLNFCHFSGGGWVAIIGDYELIYLIHFQKLIIFSSLQRILGMRALFCFVFMALGHQR